MNRREIDSSSWTGGGSWVQFQSVSFGLDSAGKVINCSKVGPLRAETETAGSKFWVWQLKGQSPATALRHSSSNKLNGFHTYR
jgi:hypothetical protein